MKAFSPLFLFSVLLTACGGDAPPAEEAAAGGQAKIGDEAPVTRAAVVKETVSTERYTFARMDSCGEEAWVAGPVTAFEPEQPVEMVGGMGMKEFHSDTLDRTFEKILFVDTWKVSETPISCEPEKKLDPDKPVQEFRVGTVKEAVDAAGYTYARLDVCGQEVWVAAPTTSVEVGSIGATPLGDEMKDFESSALEKTFDSVWFVPWIKRSPTLPPC